MLVMTQDPDYQTVVNSDPNVRYTGETTTNMTSVSYLAGKFKSICDSVSACRCIGLIFGTNAYLGYDMVPSQPGAISLQDASTLSESGGP